MRSKDENDNRAVIRPGRRAVSDRLFYRRLAVISAPIVFQSLMLALVAACDALMLGQIQ